MEINSYPELESFLLKETRGNKKAEIILPEKWFYFLVRLINFQLKLDINDREIVEFTVVINHTRCKVNKRGVSNDL